MVHSQQTQNHKQFKPLAEEVKTAETDKTTNWFYTDIVDTKNKDIIQHTGKISTNQTRNSLYYPFKATNNYS